MAQIRLIFLLAVFLMALMSFSGCTMIPSYENSGGPDMNFRQFMREFVQGISSYARTSDPDFIVIPQNGHAILSKGTNSSAMPALDYVKAIDGIGREDLFYGAQSDNVATKKQDTDAMLAYMDLAMDRDLKVLVTDYCSDHAKMDDSYQKNNDRGHISFAADHRDLDNIPDHPQQPYNVSADNIMSLQKARNFLYLLNPQGYQTKNDFLSALRATDFDVLIIDAFYQETQLTSSDVASLKTKSNGGKRLVISYMSIGEAEDYRYYWDRSWKNDKPAWLDKENPNWKGNYKVRYWHKEWQDKIYGSDASYTHRILDAGFDGVYLDIIDAYEYYE